jgi:ribosomal-protein-alanine N-acetyltransferase
MLITTSHDGSLLCRRLITADARGLSLLFEALCEHNDHRLFHPHPLTAETAAALAQQHANPHTVLANRDEYHVVLDSATRNQDGKETIVAYGMLRGWSEGFDVPSLGIAVHPQQRGRGIARQFMQHLHRVAIGRGAERVRLKVYRHNQAAVSLYESLGYAFTPHGNAEWLGTATIAARARLLSDHTTTSRSRAA